MYLTVNQGKHSGIVHSLFVVRFRHILHVLCFFFYEKFALSAVSSVLLRSRQRMEDTILICIVLSRVSENDSVGSRHSENITKRRSGTRVHHESRVKRTSLSRGRIRGSENEVWRRGNTPDCYLWWTNFSRLVMAIFQAKWRPSGTAGAWKAAVLASSLSIASSFSFYRILRCTFPPPSGEGWLRLTPSAPVGPITSIALW